MKWYSCKCGKRTSYGSMSPSRCTGCEKCGTGLEREDLAIEHRAPEPHEYETKYHEDTGEKYERCKRCYEKKEKEGKC